MVRILICYASFSGNTEEVAEIIEQTLNKEGYQTDVYRIGTGVVPDPSKYELMMIGSFTWAKGQTPIDVKDFVYEIGYKPNNVFVFGTGDTQFGGDDLFCKAAEKLAIFYESTYQPLKIEQSPRGQQEKLVVQWAKGVIDHARNSHKSKST